MQRMLGAIPFMPTTTQAHLTTAFVLRHRARITRWCLLSLAVLERASSALSCKAACALLAQRKNVCTVRTIFLTRAQRGSHHVLTMRLLITI